MNTCYLIVANRTLDDPRLEMEIEHRMAEGANEFHILVPTENPPDATDDEPIDAIEDRLRRAMDTFRQMGAGVTSEIVDDDPLHAVKSAFDERPYGAVIVATLPPGPSKWIAMDLPARIARSVDVPVWPIEYPVAA